MNIFFQIFSNFSFLMFLLWIFLFEYLFFKIIKNKLVINYKILNFQRKHVFGNISYQKIFYLLLLMFLLTQVLPYNIVFNNSLQVTKVYRFQNFMMLNYFISIFTLLTFYFFIFSFFLGINNNNMEKKYTLQFISFLFLFINLFFNLVAIPNQTLNLLNAINIFSVIPFIFIYILVFRLFLNFFKCFFTFSITQIIKLTLFIFNYQGIKDIFINNENKINILVFLKQLWSIFLLLAENEENYTLLLNTTTNSSNSKLLVSDISIINTKVIKRNISFNGKNKKVFLKDKILKDYIVVNGWKMSLIQ
ncbi:hypothetical protein [Spiroplasma endosymbiont of Tricholauxania praeusta]|uniref:hypothetical protein n=1 Tax=Spiroplasma endosymbiont of Tricholauxania praeusta TaxID=3066296 RepID=UPI0030D4BD62